MMIWREGTLIRQARPRAGIMTSDLYLNSPTRVVHDTRRPFRCRLAVAGDLGMPVLGELRDEGATDYLMLPLAFADTARVAGASFATRAARGFTDGEIAALQLAARLASPYAERAVLRRIAVDLLAAYVGPAAGRRVFEGHVARGDVETIVATAMEKDPSCRYPSAGAFAADIRRHLSDTPILARPSSGIDQLRKFGRRHRTLVASAALVLLATTTAALTLTAG